jgi:hypothetical protein
MQYLRVLGGKAVNPFFLPVLQIACCLIGHPVLFINLLLFGEFLFITSARYTDLALIIPSPAFQIVWWLIALLGCLKPAREISKRAFLASHDPNARAPELIQ